MTLKFKWNGIYQLKQNKKRYIPVFAVSPQNNSYLHVIGHVSNSYFELLTINYKTMYIADIPKIV